MKCNIIITGRSQAGKSFFLKEVEKYLATTLKIVWSIEEVPLSFFLKQTAPSRPDIIFIIECSPLISSFRDQRLTLSSVDLQQENINDQIIRYLQQLNNVVIIYNNSSIEEFKVSIKKNLKNFFKTT